MNVYHHIQLHNANSVTRKSRHIEHMISEVAEIELYLNMNRENGFSLSKSWELVIQSVKEHAEVLARTWHTFPFITSAPMVFVRTFVASCLDYRTFQMSFRSAISTHRGTVVAMGRFACLVLFSLYVNDIPMLSCHTELAQYANDTALTATSGSLMTSR